MFVEILGKEKEGVIFHGADIVGAHFGRRLVFNMRLFPRFVSVFIYVVIKFFLAPKIHKSVRWFINKLIDENFLDEIKYLLKTN